MQNSTGDKWVVYSIFAHELGHHFNGHTSSNDPNLRLQELQADYYTGFVPAKCGASLEEAQEALKTCEALHPKSAQAGNVTHPPNNDRLKETEKGWNEGKAPSQNNYSQNDSKTTSVQNRKSPEKQKNEADKAFDELHERVGKQDK